MKKIFIWLFLTFSSFTLCGCSGTESERDTQVVDIIIKDHKFEPKEIVVPQNKLIKLVVHNQDASIEEFESYDLKREKIVPAGGQVSIMIAPLAPGKYSFFGDFNQDTAQGCLIVQ
jgi:Cupredoxin-like domain